jgi:hypothetical protein
LHHRNLNFTVRYHDQVAIRQSRGRSEPFCFWHFADVIEGSHDELEGLRLLLGVVRVGHLRLGN